MKLLMVTNTFTPHVGGVARSVQQFTAEFRRLGHEVLTVAPEFPEAVPDPRVVRIPAVQRFNGSDFSVPVPIPGLLWQAVDSFRPDIIHSQHPFLLGDTALRLSARLDIPVVFTHHTQYERYTHYVPGDSKLLKDFVIELATGYCNLCDAVIAPSRSILDRLVRYGVASEIHEIPTGVDTKFFAQGDGQSIRQQLGIPSDEFVIGHVGRLAPEKGLEFLSQAVTQFMRSHPKTQFLVAGSGDSEATICDEFQAAGLTDRLHLLGSLDRPELPGVYAAMDVFAFSSQSETQGMVLTEAMSAGTPVVAVDASGVREVMQTGVNGIMLPKEIITEFAHALHLIRVLPPAVRERLRGSTAESVEPFSMRATAQQAVELYQNLISRGRSDIHHGRDLWSIARRRFDEEFKIWSNVATAATHAIAIAAENNGLSPHLGGDP